MTPSALRRGARPAGAHRELADRELAPRVDDFEARGEFPREVLRTLGRAGLLGLPYPEEHGGGGQPYEVYLQVLEVLAGRWLAVAEACQRAHAGLLSRRRVRHRRAARTAAARPARRRTARRVLPVRAAGRLRRRGADHPGGARRRRLRGHRHQGVDHPRRRRRLLQRLLPHRRPRRRAASPACSPTPAHAGHRAAGAERTMGLRSSPVAQIAFDDARVPADRLVGDEGGGFAIAHGGAGRRPARHRGLRGRAGPGARWTTRSATPGSGSSSAGRSSTSRARVHARRHGHPDLGRAGADAGGRPAARRRPAVLASRRPRRSCSPPTRRCGSPPTRCRCSAAPATWPTTRSSGTCARRRCCRSSRAPTRSSGW